MRVAQVSFFRDPGSRAPERLLDAWPTLPRVAQAARGDGTDLRVFQACHVDDRLVRGDVTFEFVRSCWGLPVAPGRRRIPVSASRLVRAVQRYAPDVIHVQGFGHPMLTRRLALGTGAAMFLQDHAGRVPRRVTRPLYRWGLGWADGIGVTDRDQARPFVEAGLLSGRTKVYEVLESSSEFTPGDRDEARGASGIHGDPAVLWVGRLAPIKDPLTMVAGFRAAVARLPDAHVWCWYTDAPLLSTIRRVVDGDEVLRSRVHLMGATPHANVETLCRAADVFVSSSVREVCGYAVIEALACGLPVVVTDIPAFRRITRGARSGALYPPKEPGALADALVDWYRSRPLDQRQATRAHFERRCSFKVLGEELRAAYRGVVEDRCASR